MPFCSLLLATACGDPEAGGVRGGNPGPRNPRADASVDDGGMPDAEVPDAGPETTRCDEVECDPLALCDDRSGDAVCTCQAGLTGSGMVCEDLDECADAESNDCAAEAECINSFRSFSCACLDGFEGDGRRCSDVDECGAGLSTCSPDARCDNAAPGYDCTCGAGFDGDGYACADVDECAAGTDDCGGAGQTCENRRGSFTCGCGPGYADDGNGGCAGLCTLAACGTPCEVQGDTASCSCVGDGNCMDLDDCEGSALCGTDGACVPFGAGYTCGCAPGFERQGGACVDVDECTLGIDLCDDNADCQNTPGGHTCACRAGFDGDGASCADVDECAAGTDDCLDSDTATCRNTLGSFVCGCRKGYEGDGRTSCDNLDECADPQLNACDDNADCEDLDPADDPLGYACTCREGFVGTGLSCETPDPCLDSRQNDCDDNAECESDGEGNYTCTCGPGFVGDGDACHCPLSGYWAMRQDVMISWPSQEAGGTVIIEAGTQLASVWELHRYDYDPDTGEITVDKKGCGSDRSPDIYSPFYEEVYGSYVPDGVFDDLDLARGKTIPMASTDAVPGYDFRTPSEGALVGLSLDDVENDPWPETRNDPGIEWVDVEGDGQLGFTVWQRSATTETICGSTDMSCNYSYPAISLVTGTSTIARRAACVSLASRVITHYDASIRSCDRITGSVTNESTEVRVRSCWRVPSDGWEAAVSCDADALKRLSPCNQSEADFLDGQSQNQVSTATFELVRIGELGDSVNCPAVRSALPAIPRN